MNSQVTDILQELYEMDPKLHSREKDLIPIIELLLQKNPGRSPDESFVQELRHHLREKAHALSGESASSPFSFLTMANFSYAIAGALVAVIVTVPTVQYLSKTSPTSFAPTNDKTLFSYSVSDAGKEAFGDLSNLSTTGMSGRGGGGGGGPAPAADMAMTEQATNPVEGKMMVDPGFNPEIIEYDFVVNGDMPALTDETVSVYKRQKGDVKIPLTSLASTFNVGMLDLKTFAGANVESVNFIEQKPYGYSINLMLRDGSVGISQNWEQWPHPESKCTTEECYRSMQLKIDQLPSDESLIAIAEAFVKEHGIDVSKYGKPEVDKTWKFDYDRATDKSTAYVPESQRVVYPLLIDGQEVQEEWGGKTGISVNVSVREKKVSDMYGLMSMNLQKSSYPAVTDKAEVEAFLKSTDQTPMPYRPKDAKVRTVKVTLGAPTVAYTKFYSYENMQSQELMAPALVFPVESAEGEPYYYRRSIIVPLAKKILESRQNQGNPEMLR